MKTSKQQISLFTGDKSTSLQVDFPASPFHLPGSEEAQKMTATSGRRCLERLERFNRVGLWAKMFSALLIGMEGWYSERCYLTWKMKGMKSNRLLFQLVPSTHRTEGIGFGLLPTPQTEENGNYSQLSQGITHRKSGCKIHVTLDAVAKMGLLPTQTSVSDLKGGCTRTEDRQNDTLAHSMHGIVNGEPGTTSQLNHRFVAEMMGFPVNWTELPFLNCETNPSNVTETPSSQR